MTIVLISAGADKATKTEGPVRLLAGSLDPHLPWLEVAGHTWIDGDLYGLQSAGPLVVKTTRAILKRIGAVLIVLSTRMQRYLAENDFNLPGTQLIPNGVDITRFYPRSNLNQPQQYTKTVVCVSKARYEKGIDVLLHAWHLVQAEIPESRLIIVGNGPLQSQLEHMAEALHIRQSIEFAGLQSDVPAQIHRGLISVLPSRWEGMPNALLEAMACEHACIATRVSGSEDLIQSGVNGLLVDVEDYQDMAHALLTVLNDTSLALRYGIAARTLIEQQYTLNKVMDMYIAIYQRLFNQSKTAINMQTIPIENRSLAR